MVDAADRETDAEWKSQHVNGSCAGFARGPLAFLRTTIVALHFEAVRFSWDRLPACGSLLWRDPTHDRLEAYPTELLTA
jgi:hypothetical protein